MSSLLLTSPKALSVDNLAAYLQWVYDQPKLDEAQEKALLRQVRQGDARAAKQIIMANLRYVVYAAKQYRGYGLSEIDLIQEGTLGLMKALKRFKLDQGVRFITYAIHWVKAEIQEYTIKNWHIVKIATTKAQRKLFFNLRSKAKELYRLSVAEARCLAEDLGVPVKEVFAMQKRMLAGSVQALDQSEDNVGGEGEALTLAEKLADDDQKSPLLSLVDQESPGIVKQALAQLDERAQTIVEARWLRDDKVKLHDLAALLKISAERVRQLEKQALESLKQIIFEQEHQGL
jgi:RNA polymerase sigma-32 factor